VRRLACTQVVGASLADCARRYSDDEYEYRHVQLPKQMLKIIPKDYFDGARGTLKLLWEEEWRALGITQVRTLPASAQPRADSRCRAWDGSITKSTSQSHIFCSSSVSDHHHLSPPADE